MISFITVCRLFECHAFDELRNVLSDVTLDRRAIGDPVHRRPPLPIVEVQEEAALSWNRFLGDTVFGFDFAFFVEEVDGLHRTQSAHVHCTPSQEDSEFPLGENRHRHHAHRTFYRGSPIPMSLRRDSLSLSLSLSFSLSVSLSLPLPTSLLLSLSFFLFLTLHSMSLVVSSLHVSRRPEETKLLCASVDVYTRACRHTSARENPRAPRIYMHDSLHCDSLSLSFSLHLPMQFSLLLRFAHLLLPLHYGLLFASIF